MARKKRPIAVIDSETDPFGHGRVINPFVWGFYDGSIYKEFWGEDNYCSEDLADYLRDENYLIYAHNGGKFDYLFLLEFLEPDLMLINGRIAKCYLGGNELRDSYSILPLPLSAHAKNAFDYKKLEKDVRHNYTREISDYLKSDCEYLYDWVNKFVNRHGTPLTLSSAVFKQIKATGYEISRTSEFYDSMFRPFYYGGRVQCFEVGSFYEDFEYVDINSAYPRAMIEDHPYGTDYYEIPGLPKDHGGYFAHVTAKSRGAFPYRDKKGKLHFPDDNKSRDYFVTGWEVLAGLETETIEIEKVHKVYKFQRRKSFKEHILARYREKLEAEERGDKDARLFSKFEMNTGYGKLAQDGRKFKEYSLQEYGYYPEKHQDWRVHADIEGIHTIFERPNPENSFYNVATAASITGYVRAELWREICRADRPMYCDTDSLMCKKFKGKIGRELGEWSYEGVDGQLTEAHIAQKKMYAAKYRNPEPPKNEGDEIEWYKVASKGVQLTAEQIIHGIASGEDLVVYRESPTFSLKLGLDATIEQRFGTRYMDRTVHFSRIFDVEEID